jgi:hypothetical protein
MSGVNGVDVVISADKMACYICINDPCDCSLDEIKEVLSHHGVVFGISDSAIRTALSGERGKVYQVAWGIPAHGSFSPAGSSEPRLVFRFSQSNHKPPEEIVVGPSFAHDWSRLCARGFVRAGTSLAFIRNPEECSFGMAVTGERLPYVAGKPVFKCGPNTASSPDGKSVLATKSGIPYLENNMPSVLDSIRIVGDIGPLTGDVSFPGDVIVVGNVLQGFHISTWGRLTLKGNLSGSASCASDIVVEGSINAPNGTIESGGTVLARFCENSVIRAQGEVIVSEYTMHSVVETEKRVSLGAKRGRIVGGIMRAKEGVSTHSVGSAMNVATVVEVGVSPKIRREYESIRKDIGTVNEEIRRIMIIDPASASESEHVNLDALYLKRLRALFEDKREDLLTRLASIEEAMRKSRNGYFYAQEVMPGTKVVLGMDVYEFNEVKHEVSIGVNTDETY